MNDTTIRLKKETKDRLAYHGRKDDSYDKIVNEVLDWIECGRRYDD